MAGAPHRPCSHHPPLPSPFVLAHLPQGCGLALDVACGRGRHSLALARRGFVVEALDRDQRALRELAARAREEGLEVRPACIDLVHWRPPRCRYEVIVKSFYLQRDLFPALAAALRPGGTLIAETYLLEQLTIGHPRNPDFLLRPNELLGLASGLRVIAYREGLETREGHRAYLASLAARREPP